jgi:hypothetical protein
MYTQNICKNQACDAKNEPLYLAFTIVINRNYIETNMIILARWVDKAVDQAFSRKNIISRLKSTGIWPH